MAKNLLIVESPAKAKTIEKYLGKDYKVVSSYGHIRDLPKKNDAIDVENGFVPRYDVPKEKEKVVKELLKYNKSAETVYLATDEDREGEAISWHLAEILKLDVDTTKRISYSEITKSAIQKAIDNPRKINMDLVNAQQARRVLDRLVGFELSPVLWRKVKPGLSAGRVQSVAVRLIVEREREIQAFDSKSFFKLQGFFNALDIEGKKTMIRADYSKNLDSLKNAEETIDSFVGASYSIGDIVKKEGEKRPAAPFTTSTLQQEASKKLSYSVSKTMQIAQKLYEAGHITYMRTDSVHLSNQAISDSEKAIKKIYGDDYHKTRTFANKASNAQEAHEAIRPTDFTLQDVEASRDEMRLYDLIWKRAIASQMADAKVETTTVSIVNDKNNISLKAKQEVIVFEGFLKAYIIEKDEDSEEEGDTYLPPMKVGQEMDLAYLTATEKFTNHPPRYNEAALVKKLEELGIGRPSTYAPTISTVQKREYVLKDYRDGVETPFKVVMLKDNKKKINEETMMRGASKAKLFPTDIGILVNDFLVEHFESVIDYGFTAEIEQEFDEISKGKKNWNEMLKEFYTPFHRNVEQTIETADRVSGERILGDHPETGEVVLARMGRFGPMVQIGKLKEDDPDFKPKYARVRKNMSIETITLEEALELFKLPRILGQFEEQDVKVNIGRFGPYVQLGSYFVSLKKEDDVNAIDFDTAIERIKEKRELDAKKLILDFPEEGIQVLNGRWGPYIKKDKANYRIPKDKEAKRLSIEEIRGLIAAQDSKKKPKKK